MRTPNPQQANLRYQLAGIALTPGADLHERAAAVLEALGRILPCDATWLAVRDPEQRRHVPLATAGATEPLLGYFRYFRTAEADAETEAEQLGLNRRRTPVLASESPIPLAELRSWTEYLLPAGFRGGLGAGLFTPGGRHLGFLSLLSADPARPGPADRRLVAAVTPVIAQVLDRARQIAETARIVEAACGGVVLTRGGDTLPLPGLPDHRLLAPGSRILATAAAELADADTYVAFLAPTGKTHDGDEGLVRVTALDCARPELDQLAAAVVLSPPGDLHGLSPLHLCLLGLLAEGATGVPAIAVALGIDLRTAADALHATLSALETTDLTAATMRATGGGLRIPPRLASLA